MYIVVLAIFAVMIANIVAFGDVWLKSQKKHLRSNETLTSSVSGGVTTYTFKDLHKKNSVYPIVSPSISKSKLDKETVQKVMIRTCNTIYQKGIWNSCPNPKSTDITWKWATDVSTKGKLVNVWNGSRNSTFSCGNEAAYGRYLLHQSLPKDIVSQYGYDLNGLDNTRAYPCGYSEIIYKL